MRRLPLGPSAASLRSLAGSRPLATSPRIASPPRAQLAKDMLSTSREGRGAWLRRDDTGRGRTSRRTNVLPASVTRTPRCTVEYHHVLSTGWALELFDPSLRELHRRRTFLPAGCGPVADPFGGRTFRLCRLVSEGIGLKTQIARVLSGPRGCVASCHVQPLTFNQRVVGSIPTALTNKTSN